MMSRSHLSFVVLILSIVCSDGVVSAQTPAVPPAASSAPAAAEDRSLTVAEAGPLGFPPLDRAWKSADYDAATQLLSRLGTIEAYRLPRSGSDRSGELFTRLTSTKNFASFSDPAVEVKDRVTEAVQVLQSLRRLGEIYGSAADRKFVTTTETTLLQGALLHAARRVTPIINEYAATLDKADPAYAGRMDGLTKMKTVVAEMVSGVVVAVGDDEMAEADRRRLIETAQIALPELLPLLPDPLRQVMVLRLKFIAVNTESTKLQGALRKLADDVSKAVAQVAP